MAVRRRLPGWTGISHLFGMGENSIDTAGPDWKWAAGAANQ